MQEKEYTNEELEKLMADAAGDNAGGNKESDEERSPKQSLGSKYSPVQIMGEAKAQGLSIPYAKIGAFLLCVLKGVMTKPLPTAVLDCAKSIGVTSHGGMTTE